MMLLHAVPHGFFILTICFWLISSVPQIAWSATWLVPTSGAWEDGSNWSSSPNYPGDSVIGAVPATIDVDGAAFTVSLSTSVRINDLTLGAQNLTLDLLSGETIEVGLEGRPHLPDCSFPPCGAIPPDGVNFFEGIAADLVVGQIGGATVEQLGGAIKISDGFQIGSQLGEVGEYTISQGDLEITRYWDYVDGFTPASGAWIQRGGELHVGEAGTGILNIEEGATVKIARDAAISIGELAGSDGTVRVTGQGSQLVLDGTPVQPGIQIAGLGHNGRGNLFIQDGGRVKLDSLVLGKQSNGMGVLELTGANSVLELDYSIAVESGRAHISDGAQVLGIGVSSSARAGATAEFLAEGRDTVVDGWLFVAGSGASSVEIRDGALATTYWAFVGGKSGTVSVDGPGTEWRILADNYVPHINSYLYVLATGSVSISNGALVVSQIGYVGFGSGPGGIVSIEGPGSRWDSRASIYVGGTALDTRPQLAPGTLRLSNEGAVSVAGVLKIWPTGRLEGSGVVEGDVENSGVIAPGQLAGQLTVEGDLAHSGILDVGIGGLEAGRSNDQLVVNGGLMLDGSLRLSLLDGYTPSASDVFSIVSAREIVGAFSNAAPGERLETQGAEGSFLVNYVSGAGLSQIVLSSFLPPSIDGDFNRNGEVDAADYILWRKNDGTQQSYNIWRANFGRTPAGSLSNGTVPEPASSVLLILGAVSRNWSRHRRHVASTK